MKLKSDSTEQKLRGGYYTPDIIADFINNWAFSDTNVVIRDILEPSCGDGVFLESLIRLAYTENRRCTAIELLESEAELARNKTLEHPNISVIQDDFYSFFENDLLNNRFDLVIGNPPYIRYQYLTPEQRETQSRILVSNGMKSNKLINSWVSFMVASVQILSNNGKIGMVIPAELLQVAYAEDLRQFLVDNLSKITVITFEELIFPDVQQEVVLFLGEKGININEENKISVVQLRNLDSLNRRFINEPIEYKPVDHTNDKWTKYFLARNEIDLINRIKESDRFVKFSDISKIDIGITTGDNHFFSVNKETVRDYNLENVVLPLIGRSAHASGLFFTFDDWQRNVEKGLDAQLVDFPDIPLSEYPEGHKRYINYGEEKEVNKGYKCSIRNRWYRVPSIWAPHAFFLRRNNTFPKFVLNSINAVSTDTMHRVKFKEGINHIKVLLSYYNSITFAFTEIEGRSYGGGVLEVLPGELEKIIIPDLQGIDDELANDLIKRVDKVVRDNGDINPILDEIDRRVLVEYIGLCPNEVRIFREIWKKLMKRRHMRKK